MSEKILDKSRSLYWKTKELIPVYLSYDFKLIGGFEQFEIAKELKFKYIPFQRNSKMNHKERKQFTNSVQNIKIGNKKYPVKAKVDTELWDSIKDFQILWCKEWNYAQLQNR